jgi:hypothetical protein
MTTEIRRVLEPGARWFEAVPPDQLQPANLHTTQLERRIEAMRK